MYSLFNFGHRKERITIIIKFLLSLFVPVTKATGIESDKKNKNKIRVVTRTRGKGKHFNGDTYSVDSCLRASLHLL